MMSKLKDISLQNQPAFHNSLFRKRFRVAAHNKGIGSEGKAEPHGKIIQIAGSCSLLFDLFCGEIIW